MSYKLNAVALMTLTFMLAGCGGGSSPEPTPGPTPGIQQITDGNGNVISTIHLTNGVPENSQSATQHLKDNPEKLNTTQTVDIEYYKDAPVAPTSPSSELQFSKMTSIKCSHLLYKDDQCVSFQVSYQPKNVTDNTTATYYDKKLSITGDVPFRMIAEKNTAFVTGSPVYPNLKTNFTTKIPVDGQVLDFNAAKMPATASFSNVDLTSTGTNTPIQVPFELTNNNDGTITASYRCTLTTSDGCQSDFENSALLKKYAAQDSTLSYETEDGAFSINVPFTLTYDFVITTDQGQVYDLQNPNSTQLSLLGNIIDQNPMPMSVYSLNKSTSNITLPARSSYYNDILSPIFNVFSTGPEIINGFGEITGSDFDINFTDINNRDNGAIHYVARSRYSFDDALFVASLIPSATPTTSAFQMAITINDPSDPSVPQIINVTGVPALENPKMVITSTDNPASGNNYQANITISGFNKTTSKQETYQSSIGYADNYKNNGVLAAFTRVSDSELNITPLTFDYNTYTIDSDGKYINDPQQKMVFINAADSLLSIVGDTENSATPVQTTINLTANNISGIPLGFACGNTDTDTNNSTCYLLMKNADPDNQYSVYKITNLNVNAGTLVSPIITKEANSPKPMYTISNNQANGNDVQINGDTGSILVMEQDNTKVNHMELFTENTAKGQEVVLPTTPLTKQLQTATNLFQY